MAGKRHHYLPRLILRRFAVRSGENSGLIWRADLTGERIRTVAPKYEAARSHYYDLPPETGLPPGFAEDVLQQIESLAGSAIASFDRGDPPDLADREALALFLLLQHRRTPAGRRELRFMDEFTAKMQAELRLSDTAAMRKVLEAELQREPTELEVEEWQTARLDELRRGEIIFESTPEREVALMFGNLETIVPKIMTEFDWRFLRIPANGPAIVLPDVGLTIYDPTPRFPEAGTGFASSERSETALYLDSQFVLLIRPGNGSGDVRTATADTVERLNIRAIACSDLCIYGPSREAVEAALALAEADPDRVEALKPRPPTFWIAEGEGEPAAGLIEFTGYSRGGTVTRELYVSQEGIDDARGRSVKVGGTEGGGDRRKARDP